MTPNGTAWAGIAMLLVKAVHMSERHRVTLSVGMVLILPNREAADGFGGEKLQRATRMGKHRSEMGVEK